MFSKYINGNKIDKFFDNVTSMVVLKIPLPNSIKYSYLFGFEEVVEYKHDIIKLSINRRLYDTTKTIYIEDILVYENGEWKYPMSQKMFKYIHTELKEIYKFNKQCKDRNISKKYKLYLQYGELYSNKDNQKKINQQKLIEIFNDR